MLRHNSLHRKFKITFSSLALIACMSYLFIRFLPNLKPLTIGLDPSWTYTINYAANKGLIFGKDIIFTYGPLGYLLTRMSFENHTWMTFSFQLILHTSLIILTFIRIQSISTSIQKIIFFVGFFVFYILVDSLGVPSQYQLLVLLFTFLSNEQFVPTKSIRAHAIFLGVFAGFALFTKFTISVCTFIAILIILVFRAYQAVKTKSNQEISLLAITDFCITLGTVSLILLNPNWLQGLAYIGLCLIVSGIVLLIQQIAVRFLLRRRQPRSEAVAVDEVQFRLKTADKYLFYTTYGLSLLLVILFSSPSLVAYIKGSLEITSGYSSAMGIVGSYQHVWIAITILVFVLTFLASGFYRNDIGFSLSLSVLLFLSFKHGFVRQDSHELIFFSLAPWIVAMQISRLRSRREIQIASVLLSYTIVVSLWGASLFLPSFSSVDRFLKYLTPQAAMSNIVHILDFNQYRVNLDKSSHDNLQERQLPLSVQKLIGNRTVDIVPWEAAIAAANDINWQPRPIFQSYSAYTAFLDNANFESLSKAPRDYLLYSFMAIDGRHPFFEEPKTFRYIFCHYNVSKQLPDSITLGSETSAIPVALLEQRSASICLPEKPAQTFALKWRETKVLPENGLATYAAIEFRYSWLGKLYKAFFRTPPIKMQVTYTNGTVGIYRVVPDNATNGLLLSYLPKDQAEAVSLLSDHPLAAVKSFQLFSNNPIVFQPKMEVKLVFFPVNLPPSQPVVDLAMLRQTKFISQSDSNVAGHIDMAQISSNVSFKDTLTVAGWALLKNSANSCWVILTLGTEQNILGVVNTETARPDVAQVLKNQDYQNSGWSATLSRENISSGEYNLKAWVYDVSKNTATLLDQRQIVLP